MSTDPMAAAGSRGDAQSPLRFTPTLDDVEAAYRLAAKRPAWRFLLMSIAAGLCVMLIVRTNQDMTPAEYAVVFAAGLVIPLSLVLIFRWIFLHYWVRRIHRQQVNLRSEHTVWWDEAGLHVETPQVAALVSWSDFIKRRENALTLLLYHSDAMFQFIPKRLLDGARAASLNRLAQQVPPKG